MTIADYDDIKVCRAAVVKLGEFPIETLVDPTTDTEATCAELYPLVVGDIESRHDWNHSNPVVQLAVDAEVEPQGNFKYAYRLPTDLIAGPFAVYAGGQFDRPIADYINAENCIHTNYDRIDVKYRRNSDPKYWPIYYTNLVVTALSAELAMPILEDTDRATELRIKAFGPADAGEDGGLLKVAKRLNDQSRPNKRLGYRGNFLLNTRF